MRQSISRLLVAACWIGCRSTVAFSTAGSTKRSPLFSNPTCTRRNPNIRQCAIATLDLLQQQSQSNQRTQQPSSSPNRRLARSNQRRALLVTASILTLTTFGSILPVPPAHASSSSSSSTLSTAPTERILERLSPNVETIIDQYVQKHMFDDDTTYTDDPVASAYREAYTDAVTGQYPAALKEITSDVLQGSKLQPTESVSSRFIGDMSIGNILTSTVNALTKRTGLTEAAATMVLAGAFVVAGPSAFLLFGMIVGGISKRNMNNLFKKRYGDTYTVDATIKPEESIEAPEDEDDDDEDDDDDDGEDGDE